MHRLNIHHIGIIVGSIESYMKNLPGVTASSPILDDIQKARIAFIRNTSKSPRIELIEPENEDSPLSNFLRKHNGGLHHICYEVASMSEVVGLKKHYRMIPIMGPVPARAIKDLNVQFFFTRNREIIEFVEIRNDL